MRKDLHKLPPLNLLWGEFKDQGAFYRHTCHVCGTDLAMEMPMLNPTINEWMKEHPQNIEELRRLRLEGNNHFPRLKHLILSTRIMPFMGKFEGLDLIPIRGRMVDPGTKKDIFSIWVFEDV